MSYRARAVGERCLCTEFYVFGEKTSTDLVAKRQANAIAAFSDVAGPTVYFTITWMSDYSTILLTFLIKKASKSLEIYATDSKRLEFSGLPLLVLPRYQITASTR
jgi:hypothetical protein